MVCKVHVPAMECRVQFILQSADDRSVLGRLSPKLEQRGTSLLSGIVENEIFVQPRKTEQQPYENLSKLSLKLILHFYSILSHYNSCLGCFM